MIVGGPNTILPHWFESFLSWLLALSCLGVAFYHYYIDLYTSSYDGISLLSFLKKLLLIPNSLLLKDEENDNDKDEQDEQDQDDVYGSNNNKIKLFIPLTTHSRREWYTVSNSYNGYKKRYHQLYTILKNEINLIDLIDPIIVIDDDNEDNDSSSNNNLFSEWLLSSPIMMAATATSKKKNKKKKSEDNNNNLNNKNDDDNYYYKPLIKLIRTNDIARRLTSLLIGTDPIDHYFEEANNSNSSSSSSSSSLSYSSSVSKRKKLWRRQLLLECRTNSTSNSNEASAAHALFQILPHIWSQLLTLPSSSTDNNNNDNNGDEYYYEYGISLIVPSYREDPKLLGIKLKRSIDNMTTISSPTISTSILDDNDTRNNSMNDNMNKVEIIIVHCIDLDDLEGNDNNKKNSSSSNNNSVSSSSSSSSSIFTDTLKHELCLLDNNPNKDNNDDSNITLTVIDYTAGGGRGPCLNYGAFHATGRILTFLHADTYLNTRGWNNAIIDTFHNKQKNNTTRTRTTTTTCCAFSFAIEKKESSSRTPQQKGIPGITAIEYTANLRSKFFQLPYGDQCLSLPSSIFQSIGGYPDQCLFEDYELIRLLRVRSSYSKNKNCLIKEEEGIQILPENYKAVCSPRRWEKYGVLYTTYTNSYMIQRYNSGSITPEELFQEYYYGGSGSGSGSGEVEKGPKRKHPTKSPWEISI